MDKIIQLNENISNMIAAGEVVERPLSVVKELVENSVDANATKIDIYLEEAGMRLIRVADNGDGMSPNDCDLAFSRHATSKIKSKHDLFNITTLGFRGEALPSIASVSRVELRSSLGGEGHFVKINGGEKEFSIPNAAKKGTDISVINLFYNTPARLKFIKSLSFEMTIISDFVTKVALMRPEISFKLFNNDKLLLSTEGSNDSLKTISQVYGIKIAKEMKELSVSNYDYKVTGYVSNPVVSRASKNYINVIINDRVIRNYNISNAIISGFGNKLPHDRYPIAVVRIECDPLLIDVNVHPNKMQVKLTDEAKLTSMIKGAVHDLLLETVAIPTIEISREKEEYKQEEIKFTYKVEESEEVLRTEETTEESNEESNEFPDLEYIGQFHRSYLLCQAVDGLYIIDQHAAAERVRYELNLEYLSKPSTESMDLLTPFNLEFSADEVLKVDEHIDKLVEQGMIIEKSGLNSYFLRRVPLWFRHGLEIEYAVELIHSIINETANKDIDKLAAILACKRSIKANDSINVNEVNTLIDDLKKCLNPYTCPHGRPTIIRYSKHEIERFFRR